MCTTWFPSRSRSLRAALGGANSRGSAFVDTKLISDDASGSGRVDAPEWVVTRGRTQRYSRALALLAPTSILGVGPRSASRLARGSNMGSQTVSVGLQVSVVPGSSFASADTTHLGRGLPCVAGRRMCAFDRVCGREGAVTLPLRLAGSFSIQGPCVSSRRR